MADATSPDTGTAPVDTSFDKGVDDITALLVDQDIPDLPENEEQAAGPDDAQADPDDAGAEDAAQDDAPEEVAAGGKFVSRDAKVRLDDGTVISVGELARNNLFQRDYTRKTEELKAERESVKAKETQFGEIAQALTAQRDFLLSVAQQVLPAPPDRAMLDPGSPKYDPIGFTQAKEEYEAKARLLTQVYHQQEAEKARKAGETTEQRAERQRVEAQRLLDAVPEFRDPGKYQSFMAEVGPVMATEYGFSPQDLAEAFEDHRYYKAMRDLVLLSKARKRAPKVQAEVQAKPRLMTGAARSDPKAKTSRDVQQRREQLRQTGSFDAGVAAIEALIS